MKNLIRFPMKILLKSFDNPVNLPWINSQDFHGFSVHSEVESVVSCRFQIHLCILACVVNREITREAVMKFLPAQFPWIWCKMSSKLKYFQPEQIQRISRKIFIAHYACRKADLKLTLVTGKTKGFIFQIINSSIESRGYAWPALTVTEKKIK